MSEAICKGRVKIGNVDFPCRKPLSRCNKSGLCKSCARNEQHTRNPTRGQNIALSGPSDRLLPKVRSA